MLIKTFISIALPVIMVEENMVVNEKTHANLQIEQRTIYSDFLERNVIIDIYLPLNTKKTDEVALLLINDGQDLRTMNFAAIVDSLLSKEIIEPIACVGLHCGADRINEYGTACRPDYKGRGALAGLYTKFVFDELLPFIKNEYKLLIKEKAFAGFSLGALCALDIVWNHAHHFKKVGVFSGALWWRRRGYEDESYNWYKDRIMHLQVQKGTHFSWLKLFFECGRLDETADRNNNGIIDSIEDTTDLIEDLKKIGYSNNQIHYTELEDGGHNIETWARAFPEFLNWGWGRSR